MRRRAKSGKSRSRTKAATGAGRRERVDAVTPPPPVAVDDGNDAPPLPAMPIVGVGASAGGLEAFSELLHAMPPHPGIALVLVQHLAPHHESALQPLLSLQTTMPVVQAADDMMVEADHVYVIPPNVQMGITGMRLQLEPRPTDRSQYTPIDAFLRRLADSARERAIAVILSGTASDGTLGAREVKAMGGITIAQRPESAKHDGMPRAAIASGFVDLVLEPADIARELVRIAHHPLEMAPQVTGAPPAARDREPHERALERIFTLLRTATGVDFGRYKQPTVHRRIQRRMLLQKLTRLDQYVAFLEEHDNELLSLYRDILIHVTRFFREPESFEALASFVFPRLLQQRTKDQPIRVWVSGCATGEEAYSIAIALLEYLEGDAGSVPIQIFGTDISEAAIEHARTGVYHESIAGDVSPARLRRFFTRTEGGYRISNAVRDMCVFARQDLTRDPPFSKLDLVLCRNVLIYLALDMQKRVVSVFHYALRPGGFLMLGHAETIGTSNDRFVSIDKKHRIYQRKDATSGLLEFPAEHVTIPPAEFRPPPRPGDARSVQHEANRIIQERFAPAGVLVDGDFQVVQFRGRTGAYLEPPQGDPSLGVLKMAREGLLFALRTSLHEASKSRRTVRKAGLRVRDGRAVRKVELEVIPIGSGDRPHFLVLFEEARHQASKGAKVAHARAVRGRSTQDDVARLEVELAGSRDYLQSTIQELEAANEELQSANEEILSSNEELQSTNEELDTAKEELQSTNEELNTVNEELLSRNEELSRANSDLLNLLASVQIAIVIVASDLRIRRFTPMAERVLNLIQTDIGRPIGHIKPNIDCPELEEMITRAIDTVTPVERDVRDQYGTLLSLRVRPYKNVDHRIDGAVLTLYEIDDATRAARATRAAVDDPAAILEALREPVLVLDDQRRIRLANGAFYQLSRLDASAVEGRVLYELDDGAWNVPQLRTLIEGDLAAAPNDGMQIEHEFGRLGRLRLVVRASRLPHGNGTGGIVVTMERRTPPDDGGSVT